MVCACQFKRVKIFESKKRKNERIKEILEGVKRKYKVQMHIKKHCFIKKGNGIRLIKKCHTSMKIKR